MDETSWMETIVSGKGTLAFKWRVECEEDDSGDHAVRWVFLKDDYDEEEGAFADHGWVSGITWTPVDPLPPLDVAAKDSDAQAIIAGLSDIRLSDTISNATAYVAFRSWVDGKGLSHALVKDAPNAWRSYVLDAPGLMTKAALTSEDVMIESVEPSGTAAGAFDLVVDIGGAEIGSAARLAVALGVEGAALATIIGQLISAFLVSTSARRLFSCSASA